MFGFGYALVPLYNVFCDITGINGKTGQITVADAKTTVVDMDRLVTVEFDTNVNTALPWKFKAQHSIRKLYIPEKLPKLFSLQKIYLNRSVVGRAVPSVAPASSLFVF